MASMITNIITIRRKKKFVTHKKYFVLNDMFGMVYDGSRFYLI